MHAAWPFKVVKFMRYVFILHSSFASRSYRDLNLICETCLSLPQTKVAPLNCEWKFMKYLKTKVWKVYVYLPYGDFFHFCYHIKNQTTNSIFGYTNSCDSNNETLVFSFIFSSSSSLSVFAAVKNFFLLFYKIILPLWKPKPVSTFIELFFDDFTYFLMLTFV
jgi:hypothetical protein